MTRAALAAAAGQHAAQADLSVDQAHQLMQAHLRCLTRACPARSAALDLLVAEGRYVLDAHPRR